jgi:hypothetical protein
VLFRSFFSDDSLHESAFRRTIRRLLDLHGSVPCIEVFIIKHWAQTQGLGRYLFPTLVFHSLPMCAWSAVKELREKPLTGEIATPETKLLNLTILLLNWIATEKFIGAAL